MVKEQMDREIKLSAEHDTKQNKKEKGLPLVAMCNSGI